MSDDKLFEDAVRGAYYDGTWLRVAHPPSNNALMINPDTGQCRGGFWGAEISYSRFKSKVIKELKRGKNEREKREAMIKKNLPIITEIKKIQSSTPTAKREKN